MIEEPDLNRKHTIRVDTTVCTVCAAALFRCLVDLNVLDDQVAGVEALGVGIGLGVLEQAEQELSRLDGPAGLGDSESLACGKENPYQYLPLVFKAYSSCASSHMAGYAFSRAYVP